MMSSNLPFNAKVPQVEHDARLVRRYLWQTLLRYLSVTALLLTVCLALPVTFIFWSLGRAPDASNWLYFGPALAIFAGFCPATISMAWQHLRGLREAGVTLTPEMISSRPHLTLPSPLDPLSTYDLCAETLSGLALGLALGYPGPAAFWHQSFKGRILLAPSRMMRLWQSMEVRVTGEPGQQAQVHVRRRFGLSFFQLQKGEAWREVQTVSDHLRAELKRRHHTLQLARREHELERAALNAKLSALQAQVEPHFLFNTLANLKYLIRTDGDTAQLMLDHLVGYLQNALPDMRSVSSTVGRELALAGDYLSIMQIRMGERLRFRIDADDALRMLPFPPAMLISLVENAIKHGLESATRPGELLIRATVDSDALRLAVRDNGAGLSDQPGQGLGLANIHERLQLLYGERASLTVEALDDGGVEATLSVPMPVLEAA
ncbi:histidine kinase [Oxalobacteraceae bacterium OTU3CAMAD1]|nr:histidine kinase [Oxalobacteraceae bacterium OTU3CAMAD1]